MLIYERSPLCMLPPPLNVLSTVGDAVSGFFVPQRLLMIDERTVFSVSGCISDYTAR